MHVNIFKAIIESIFPENYTCYICNVEIFDKKYLCDSCKAKLEFNDGATCPVCGRKTDFYELCLECKEYAPTFDMAASAFVYGGEVARLILNFKKDKPFIYKLLAYEMLKKCDSFSDAEAVCYVPMHHSDEVKRGYNQSRLLAKEIAEKLKLPLLDGALEKVKKTPQQKRLGKAERLNNLKSVFRADGKLVKGKKLIVVDDVLTTGATAEAVCSRLKAKGASKIYFLTAASVRYIPLM